MGAGACLGALFAGPFVTTLDVGDYPASEPTLCVGSIVTAASTDLTSLYLTLRQAAHRW